MIPKDILKLDLFAVLDLLDFINLIWKTFNN